MGYRLFGSTRRTRTSPSPPRHNNFRDLVSPNLITVRYASKCVRARAGYYNVAAVREGLDYSTTNATSWDKIRLWSRCRCASLAQTLCLVSRGSVGTGHCDTWPRPPSRCRGNVAWRPSNGGFHRVSSAYVVSLFSVLPPP